MSLKYNIGIDIDAICKKYKIKNYIIREDGKVDVNGNVLLRNKDLTELPLEFGVVNGYFNCSQNSLTSLKGAPNEVNGNFNCYKNNLKSIKHLPKK